MKPDVVNKLVLTSFILGLVAATPARAATFPTTGRTTVAGQAKVTFLLPEQPVAPRQLLARIWHSSSRGVDMLSTSSNCQTE
jgi:hypothetical protein